MTRNLLALALLTVFVSSSLGQSADPKQQAAELERRATEVTKQIGALATSGQLPTSEEGIALLKKLVDELSEIRTRLTALEGEVKGVKSAQAPSKTLMHGYLQFQYRDTNQPGGLSDAFQIRRARWHVDHRPDAATFVRLSADFATGTNQTQVQLRDAYARVSLSNWPGPGGFQLQGGQFSLPISWQLTRGDLEREFPERTAYMSALFNGERSRGAFGRVALGEGLTAFAGGINSLTVSDAEQASIAPGPGSRLGVMGGVNYAKDGIEAGLAGLSGKRPATTNGGVAVPEVDRHWLIASAGYDSPSRSPFSARGEFLTGKDRVPGSSAEAFRNGTDMTAWTVQVGYRFSSVSGLYLKWEDWDRDTDSGSNSLRGFGASYMHDVTPSIRFIGAYESFDDGLLARTYGVTTFRLQYRF